MKTEPNGTPGQAAQLLYRLPITGDWVDPHAVTQILFLAQDSPHHERDIYLPARVAVWIDGHPLVVTCSNDEEALRVRDEIGVAVNAARSAMQRAPT